MNQRRARAARADAFWLTGGSLVSGLAAYLFIALGTRTIGAEAFAPVSIVWTLWAVSAAVLTFPVQHWLIRTAEASNGELALRGGIRQLLIATAALTCGTLAVTLAIRSRLYSSPDLIYPLVTATVPIGSVATGWTRGILAVRHRFAAVAAVIVGENAFRVIAAVGVTIVGASARGFALSILFGFAVVVFWPGVIRLGSDGNPDPSRYSALGFMAGIAGGSLAAQLVLTAAPVILALRNGSAALVTSLFAAMALLRSPYMVATGIATRLTEPLTRAASGSLSQWKRIRVMMAGGTVAAGILAVPFGWWVLGPVLNAVFGASVSLPRTSLVLLSIGGAVSIGTLLYTLLFVALDQSPAASFSWTVAIGLAAVVLFIVADPFVSVVRAFVTAEISAFVVMALVEIGSHRRHSGIANPTSSSKAEFGPE